MAALHYRNILFKYGIVFLVGTSHTRARAFFIFGLVRRHIRTRTLVFIWSAHILRYMSDEYKDTNLCVLTPEYSCCEIVIDRNLWKKEKKITTHKHRTAVIQISFNTTATATTTNTHVYCPVCATWIHQKLMHHYLH